MGVLEGVEWFLSHIVGIRELERRSTKRESMRKYGNGHKLAMDKGSQLEIEKGTPQWRMRQRKKCGDLVINE
ncbi:hypothetical protein M413DRAFT_448850 [Hebeloma cylindrosporum]|uniref:Uncharacterized protein n=1 Tax=Hebeloma cylindrosporum TaxID=76867 RepID=A0A0C2Y7C7_HEBCY|nr:hypothetical protein M413DRAFT_448850 [Hebeloma cylindrosporum h7]